MSLNPREQRLAFGLGAALLLMLNLLFLPKLIAFNKAGRQKHAELSAQVAAASGWLARRDYWNQRREWLEKTEPDLQASREDSAVQLEQLQQSARACGLSIAEVQLLQLAPAEFYQPIGARLTLKGPWAGLVQFVSGLQNPAMFNVIPRFSIRSDDPPPNVQCELEVQRWFHFPKEATR
ncbi:MAG TPA: hypothetical protein VNQ90_09420 [Chthoniobacteraceae bacterium]|nr:hypothetical protein [Chthoniobacteraceae bacterium]